jgi:hypothetical protein
MALDNPLDNIPVEKLNPAPAVEEISKTSAGASKLLLGIWTAFNVVLLVAALIFFFNSNNTQRDKDDTYWLPKMRECDSTKQAQQKQIIELSIQAAALMEKLKRYDKQIDSIKSN